MTLTAESSSCANTNNSSKGSGGTNAAAQSKANIAAYQQGTTAQSKELAMTLDRITDPYTSPNQFTQPKAGNRFLLLHISAKNVDSHEHTVNEFSFKVKTSDSHVYDPEIVVTEGSGFKATSLSAGEITEGDVVFELPQGAEVVELRYDNGFGSDDLFWRK